LSTLTKVLIVLLTVFSIFLCGVVINYVAHAENYKELSDDYRNKYLAANRSEESAEKELENAKADFEEVRQKLQADNSRLRSERDQLQSKLDDTERQRAELYRKTMDFEALTEQLKATNESHAKNLAKVMEERNQLEEDNNKLTSQLEALDMSLTNKLALIAQLNKENRQLTEQVTELRSGLNTYLNRTGMTAGTTPTVTSPNIPIIPSVIEVTDSVSQPIKPIDLTGKILEIDLQNKLAAISIGSASGVTKGMTFHAIRGNDYLCDIIIDKVDTNHAVGKIERIKEQPRVDDIIMSNI
jgi:predicted RNase H-like nuclease (RuvC/YqgF family)